MLRILKFILLAQISFLSCRPINLWKSSWVFQRSIISNISDWLNHSPLTNSNCSSVNGSASHPIATIYLMGSWTSSSPPPSISSPPPPHSIFTTFALVQATIFYWNYCNLILVGFPIHKSNLNLSLHKLYSGFYFRPKPLPTLVSLPKSSSPFCSLLPSFKKQLRQCALQKSLS